MGLRESEGFNEEPMAMGEISLCAETALAVADLVRVYLQEVAWLVVPPKIAERTPEGCLYAIEDALRRIQALAER